MKGWTETLVQLPRLKEAGRFQTSELASQSIKDSEGRGITGLKLKPQRNNHGQKSLAGKTSFRHLEIAGEKLYRKKTSAVTNQN